MTLRATDRFTATENVHFVQFDEEMILLDLAQGEYFSLNDVGSRMWTALVAGRAPEEIARALTSDYDAEPDVLLRDCLAIAAELVRRGLLRVSQP